MARREDSGSSVCEQLKLEFGNTLIGCVTIGLLNGVCVCVCVCVRIFFLKIGRSKV